MIKKFVDKVFNGFGFGLGMGIAFITIPRDSKTIFGKDKTMINSQEHCSRSDMVQNFR